MRATGITLLCLMLPAGAHAAGQQDWAFHSQSTFIEQYHPAFRSPYRGPNSLDPGSRGNETFNITAYAGARLWDGGEAWGNLEMDQGFGLSDTLGAAAFPNGLAQKIGQSVPYLRLQRLFFRQTFDLGGEAQAVAGAANQLAGDRSKDNLILTLGKFSPNDIFDTNSYAHDPTVDFLNWALMDAGPWDYAADAWGYSYGGAAEWSFSDWSLRGGFFNLSRLPNNTALTRGFGQYQIDLEGERRFQIAGRDGKLKLLGFASRARLASYNQAAALSRATGLPADAALVRARSWKSGLSINGEQAVSDNAGIFLRAAFTDGTREAEEFTDMSNSVAAGVSIKGAFWARADDTVGLAVETGGISQAAQRYFGRGGLGILIGDGRLDHYARENVMEAYYSAALWPGVQGSLDYQFITHPAYNLDRGPVSVLGIRLHGAF